MLKTATPMYHLAPDLHNPDLELFGPYSGLTKVQEDPMDEATLTPLAEHHAIFYQSVNNTDEALKRALDDILAIDIAYPDLRSDDSLLAVAAWFAVFSQVTDLVQSLELKTAQMVLGNSIALLQAGIQPLREVASPGTPPCYRGAFLDPACEDLQPFLKGWWGVLSLSSRAMALERVSRHELDADGLEAYMGIRTRTSGLQPFFDLLKTEVYDEEDALLEVEQTMLSQLESNVAFAATLQHDITGSS
ncbi:hypothetical protein LTR62_001709 [Meristemomyces frigidus]|uniref:Terpenoid synthase n=1 Tax=Meristemomyces frigidus TaxID=1508187 RepID=A0AAN7T7S0_9PEZI|nr:hypothetical protein LTR62_001709 [Meristemomyces frigidus]